jgi:hypothetical protein
MDCHVFHPRACMTSCTLPQKLVRTTAQPPLDISIGKEADITHRCRLRRHTGERVLKLLIHCMELGTDRSFVVPFSTQQTRTNDYIWIGINVILLSKDLFFFVACVMLRKHCLSVLVVGSVTQLDGFRRWAKIPWKCVLPGTLHEKQCLA